MQGFLDKSSKSFNFSDPPEVKTLKKTVHASVGWGLNISCDVWADPPSTLEWFRGNGPMEYLDKHFQFQQMVLTIISKKIHIFFSSSDS